ncbi:MAG: gliding motility-associated ABC transporter substrate-binding protein GldG [Dysgonamonadaceae bacterium]|nr:gliding motility-associated ABC transporter substrate-binding protein GldG [Dysgonamonadaceae bacterium]
MYRKQWVTLLAKELRQNLYSLSGILFMLLFLLVSGSLLWLIPGDYNLPESGQASILPFFSIAPVLLLFLIPALSMRSFAEEKRTRTLALLKTRPVTDGAILSSKTAALFITVFGTILPTVLYAVSVCVYSRPAGNMDWGIVAASYLGLLFVVFAFIALSVFASNLTANPVIALIMGMSLCAFFYFGFNLISLDSFGFLSHYQSIRRGFLETGDLAYFLLVAFLFTRNPRTFRRSLKSAGVSAFVLLLIVSGMYFNLRFDWTKDKRYTLHPASKALLEKLDAPVTVEFYLTGNLNPGFKRLQKSALNLLADFDKASAQKLDGKTIDPYRQGEAFRKDLEQKGIRGISVNERARDGRQTQQVLFPYAWMEYKERQVAVPLLVNQMGRSGEDNLNLSVEMLEYRFAHAIQQLTREDSKRIVFLEGHAEWPEEAVSEITDYLSAEYTIDRGVLSGNPAELDGYDLVIIAGPQAPFSETDKFVLDQYLMQGGSLFWLLDGVEIRSYEELAQQGETISRANDLNLNDLFFTYGLKVNPVLLQDTQCLSIPVAGTSEANQTDYVSKPWYYSALLVPNNQSEITKGLSLVKADFASTISFSLADEIRKEVLLSSSPQAHTVSVPAAIRLEETDRQPDKTYFSESNLPVAVLLQGIFPSGFRNRSAFFAPDGYPFRAESQPAKMIVAASGELIRNPAGYDRYSQIQFANPEFILNAAGFLTDSAGISALRNKALQTQSLDFHAVQRDRNCLLFINIALPPLILTALFACLGILRKRRFASR